MLRQSGSTKISFILFCSKCCSRDIVTDSPPGGVPTRKCPKECLSWTLPEDWKHTLRIVEQTADSMEEFQEWFKPGASVSPTIGLIGYTPKQYKIAVFIKQYRAEFGYSPTLKEIAKKMGTSTVTIFEHIRALVHKGAARVRRHQSRSVEILDDGIEVK